MDYEGNIQELVVDIKKCLDIMYSPYEDMDGNKQPANETQTMSKGTSVKNKLFSCC